ncbi:hypothetical protein GS493_00810 [Rhodococcus hoagii]|nr:hypothetical protein [Prescottella equi]
MSSFIETDEQKELRAAVSKLAQRFNYVDYVLPKARKGEPLTELWTEAGKLGFLGVNLRKSTGAGERASTNWPSCRRKLAAQGAGLLLVVVSPAICGTIIGKYGTDAQKQEWLTALADGSKIMAFGITEPDAGSNRINHHTRRRDGDDWILRGNKVYISGGQTRPTR